jgi:hypothetical protein
LWYDGTGVQQVGFCAGKAHALYSRNNSANVGTALAVLGDASSRSAGHLRSRGADVNIARWIFVTDILNEGVDIPVNSVLFLRPTESSTHCFLQLNSDAACALLPGAHRYRLCRTSSLWLTSGHCMTPHSGGRRAAITDDFRKPPKSCEVVPADENAGLSKKVKRFKTKAECEEITPTPTLSNSVPVQPIDLWNH